MVGLDRERNLVRVNLSFETLDRQRRKVVREVTKEFSAAELPGRTTLLREEERSFSVGDRIVALKNDRGLGVQNGSLGGVREIDGTRMRIDLEGREVTLDLTTYRHIDHAYAVTIQKSQGATLEHSILYAPVQPDGTCAGRRARRELRADELQRAERRRHPGTFRDPRLHQLRR